YTLSLHDALPILIMLNILGSSNDKSYPLPYMAKIVDEVDQKNVQILFNYMPNQQAIVEELLAMCEYLTKEKVFKNVIAKSLRDLVVLIGQCNMVIGN